MSEVSAEERARLREVAEFAPVTETTFGAKTVLALLDEVDRLTEADNARAEWCEGVVDACLANEAQWKDRAERAERERDEAVALAVRHAGDLTRLREAIEALHSPWVEDERWCGCCNPPYYEIDDCPTSALLSDTTTESQQTPRVGTEGRGML